MVVRLQKKRKKVYFILLEFKFAFMVSVGF